MTARHKVDVGMTRYRDLLRSIAPFKGNGIFMKNSVTVHKMFSEIYYHGFISPWPEVFFSVLRSPRDRTCPH